MPEYWSLVLSKLFFFCVISTKAEGKKKLTCADSMPHTDYCESILCVCITDLDKIGLA